MHKTPFERAGVWLAICLTGLLAPIVLSPSSAFAQRTTATLTGTITQGSGTVGEGAVVVATNTESGFTITAATGKDGSYTFPGLAPGEYLITVTAPDGKEASRLVALEVGQTVEIDIPFEETAAVEVAEGETIEVIGRVGGNKTSEVGVNVSREQIDNLPQNNRNFLNFAALAPGVRLSSDQFRQNFSSGALSAQQTNVFIDGVSLKSNVQTDGVVGQDASRGNPFPQLAIAGFRVITQNFKAEYEQAGSAIISAITRSGGNEFHGDFFSALQNKTLVANDHFAEERGDPKPDYGRYQLGGSLGGPIIKDKLHFFATYEGNYQDRANQVSLGDPTPENQARFGEYAGSFGSPFREHLTFGKVSWTASKSQTVDLSASLRRETDIRSFGGQTSFENAENVRNNVFTADLRHQFWVDNILNEFTFQFLSSQFNPTVLNPDLIGQDYQGVIRVGGRDTSQNNGQEAYTVRNDISFTDLDWAGKHLVKGGFKASYQKYRVERNLFGNPTFRFRNDPDNNLDFDIPFEAQYGVGDPRVEVDNNQFGLFLQDDWQVGKKLTFNIGARWDVETNPLNNAYVTPADVRAAVVELAETVEEMNGADFFDVDNYLTDGTQRPLFLGAIQPRVGASYDVFGNQKTVLFGGGGRYYDRNVFNNGVEEQLRLQYEVRTFRFSRDGQPRDGQPTITYDPSFLSVEGLNSLIDRGIAPKPEIFLLENDTRPLHTDQYSIGVRQQFGSFGTSFTVTHMRSENGLGFYPANRAATGDRNFIPTPGNFGNVIISADDRTSRFTGVYVTVDRPLSAPAFRGIQWGMSLAYTYGKGRERGGEFNFDFPTIKDSPEVPTATDERHRLILSGIVGLPLGFKASTLITLGTGLPYTISDASQGFGADQFVLLRNGGRADGTLQFKQVDLRVAKDFKVFKEQKATVYAEAFNLFNFDNFGGYDGFIPPETGDPNPNFGKPTNLIGPTRSLQVGLAYGF